MFIAPSFVAVTEAYEILLFGAGFFGDRARFLLIAASSSLIDLAKWTESYFSIGLLPWSWVAI